MKLLFQNIIILNNVFAIMVHSWEIHEVSTKIDSASWIIVDSPGFIDQFQSR